MQNFMIGAGIQFLSYFNLTLNFRAIAHGHIAFAMVTDGLAVLLAYTIIRRVARDDKSWATLVGMVVGGSLAAAAGIYLTQHWG